MSFAEFHDPRLVALDDDPLRVDMEFWLTLVEELAPASVVDIGCGTGEITCALARLGHAVTGVDPASAMLEVARHRPGGELVRWVEGDATDLDGPPADLALMTAHVAQVIPDETEWRRALAGTHAALRPGGRLAFDSRNPAAQAWLGWTPESTSRRRDDTPLGAVDIWWDVIEVNGDLVRTEIHYRFLATGEELVSRNELRFRTRAQLEAALVEAGFAVERVLAGWGAEAADAESAELVFVAARR